MTIQRDKKVIEYIRLQSSHASTFESRTLAGRALEMIEAKDKSAEGFYQAFARSYHLKQTRHKTKKGR